MNVYTLFHSVEISDDVIYSFFVVRYVHGIVELDVLGFELGLEHFESLGKFPFGSHLWERLALLVEVSRVAYREAPRTAS